MKRILFVALTSLALLLPSGSSLAGAQRAAAADLDALVTRIQTKLEQGKKTRAELAGELKGFDTLVTKYQGNGTDDAAVILWTAAKFYLQVLDDGAKSRQLVQQLKRDFPHTEAGRKADELLASITAHEEAEIIQARLQPGVKFPVFDEKDADRNELALAHFQGKVVLIHFWAACSRPCVVELDNLLDLYQRYHPRGFEIIGISLDQDELVLSGFRAQKRIPWPQLCDGRAWKSKLVVQYGINRIPANYLLGRDGRIIGKDLHDSALEGEVARALALK